MESLMAVVRERDGDTYYATAENASGEIRYRLVVERMNGSWDWTAWKPGYPEVSARHGVADTVQDAMREAEQAAQ
jgi:hypothetical protein